MWVWYPLCGLVGDGTVQIVATGHRRTWHLTELSARTFCTFARESSSLACSDRLAATEHPVSYEIELSATEHGAIPPATRGGSLSGYRLAAGPRTTRPTPRRTGPTYIYECTYCRKRFPRLKHDSKLRPHRNPAGWDCPGRTGYLIETRH